MQQTEFDDLIDFFDDLKLKPKNIDDPNVDLDDYNPDYIDDDSTDDLDDVPDNDPELDKDALDFYNKVKALKILDLEDDEEPTDIDGVQAKLLKSKEKLYETTKQEIENSFPPEVKEIYEFLKLGGNFEEYLQSLAPVNYDDIDLEDLDTQRELVFTSFKQSSKYSDDKIMRLIAAAEKAGDLREAAEEALEELREQNESKKTSLIERQKQQQAESKRKLEETTNKLFETIEQKSTLDPKRKARIKAVIATPTSFNSTSTQLTKTLTDIFDNPDHLVELIDLVLADYNPKTGFNYERLEQRFKTKANNTLKDILRNTPPLPKGKGGKAPKNSFSVTEFLSRDL